MTDQRAVFIRAALSVLLIALTVMILPAEAGTPMTEDETMQISMTFEEYLAQSEEPWFLTGKNEYSIQAMMVSEETSFHNDLEAADYTVMNDGVTVILKGRFDEMWAAKLSKVISAYTKPDGSALSEADFAGKDSWIAITTKPEPDAYYAMYVPLHITVTVETAWGDVLHANLPNALHGDGDYLVCRAGENGEPDFSDVWILNGVVFPEYYDTGNCMRPDLLQR